MGGRCPVVDAAPAPPGPPCTAESIAQDLESLGVSSGQILLVHSSMRAVGHTLGGPGAVVAALQEVLGRSGTLVVPAFTPENSDTSRSYLAAVATMSPGEVRHYRARMPAFDAAETPCPAMGVIAEQVRLTPGAIRSLHPQTSFAAVGPLASELMRGHAPDCHLGEASPLARLYEQQAMILLLGVGYQACSAFHLAEYRYRDDPPRRSYRCVVRRNGRTAWWEYQDAVLDDSAIDEFGREYEQMGAVTSGNVGDAHSRLLPLVSLVDAAAGWLRRQRK